eukprot:GHVP01025196.1.p1 GENE.GHVP01025196.1~~GHVP01025196.1.p1  ORF type:complete len:357 (+),score=21.88 GHVP01025196.1:76-1146(+)
MLAVVSTQSPGVNKKNKIITTVIIIAIVLAVVLEPILILRNKSSDSDTNASDTSNNSDNNTTLTLSPNKNGHRGLKNKGYNLCYMNVIIQSLFFLPKFRKYIYCQDHNTDILKALNDIFHKMQFEDSLTDATKVVEKLGGTIGKQEDSSEYYVQLINVLGDKSVKSMMLCKFDDNTESIRSGETEESDSEAFCNIVIDATQDTNLVEDIKNKYIDGLTTPSFTKYELPSVLYIQLSRLHFIKKQKHSIKTDNKYEFPEILDLCSLTQNDVDDITRTDVYELAQVIVHVGQTSDSGHYYIYIKDPGTEEWFKFDDETVSEVTKEEVMHAHPTYSTAPHMLTYVRQSDMNDIFCEIQV